MLLGSLVALWWWRATLLAAAGGFLDTSESPGSADYILILGGDYEYRPAVAAALYKAGYSRHILLVTGRIGPGAAEEATLPGVEVNRNVLVARGVPRTAIEILDGEVDSTADEADALARFLESRPGCSVLIVTTDLHTRRASRTFRRHVGARAASLRFVAAPSHGFDASDWWQSEDGLVAYLNEYTKLVVYWVRG